MTVIEDTIEKVDEYIKTTNILELAKFTVEVLELIPKGILPDKAQELLDVAYKILNDVEVPDHPE